MGSAIYIALLIILFLVADNHDSGGRLRFIASLDTAQNDPKIARQAYSGRFIDPKPNKCRTLPQISSASRPVSGTPKHVECNPSFGIYVRTPGTSCLFKSALDHAERLECFVITRLVSKYLQARFGKDHHYWPPNVQRQTPLYLSTEEKKLVLLHWFHRIPVEYLMWQCKQLEKPPGISPLTPIKQSIMPNSHNFHFSCNMQSVHIHGRSRPVSHDSLLTH
ncbi:uncharacterized protein BO96DRAFT_461256 [Aspergillus niger CBS 101883]|uniref:uncharacterized protein n=1 Tax=Aspergillus lacticoffeatus (strain CBS 101883) TaxID=1450533 RepID=UPI000D7EEF53|nr:uncharacterized protein BO96DRAFT_461256 [Aspergillus niger CBS 101883]PYH61760.1 hypothetical protein BO96DRAFT_461256 [Aspergillus niger CBS 101883]